MPESLKLWELEGTSTTTKTPATAETMATAGTPKKQERRKKQKRQQMNFGGPSREKIVKRAIISFKYSDN
jgi:hypothetical protein